MPEPAPEYPLFRCKNFFDHDPPCLDGWVRAQGIICPKCIEKGWFDMSESSTSRDVLEYEDSSSGIKGRLFERGFHDAEPLEGGHLEIADGLAVVGSHSPALTRSTIFTTHALMHNSNL